MGGGSNNTDMFRIFYLARGRRVSPLSPHQAAAPQLVSRQPGLHLQPAAAVGKLVSIIAKGVVKKSLCPCLQPGYSSTY